MNYHGKYKVPGGKLVVADFAVVNGRLANVVITGDFFLYPEEAIYRLGPALEGAPIDADLSTWADLIRTVVGPDVTMLGFGPEDIAEAIRRGLP